MKPTTWKYFQANFEYEAIFNDVEWPWAGHKQFIYDLIRNLKPKTIVELGTHKGTSFFSMCQAMKDEGLKAQIFAVDTWKGDKQAGIYDESVIEEVKLIQNKYYSNVSSKLLRMTFDEANKLFNDKSISLLHIDGLHTYKAVRHDFDTWISKLTDNGIIIFHDIAEKQDDFGVYRLWDEIKLKYSFLQFFHSHGLGVLFINRQSNHFIELQEVWTSYYSLLHEYQQQKHTNSKLNEENAVLTTQQIQNEKIKKKYEASIKEAVQNEKIKKKYEASIKEAVRLTTKIQILQKEIDMIEYQINRITSAKFYKLWQLLTVKKSIL